MANLKIFLAAVMLFVNTLWMDEFALAGNPSCPANSLNGKGCSTVTSSSTCPTYYMPGSNGSSSVACKWNGSSCSDGGGDCSVNGTPPPPPTCPVNSLNGSGCSTVTDSNTCSSYYMPGSNGSSSVACSWNGSSCSDGGGDCTGGSSPPPPPKACPSTSLNGSGCSTITDGSTCPSYYMPGSNGSSSIACSWNGSSCSDGGGDCTPHQGGRYSTMVQTNLEKPRFAEMDTPPVISLSAEIRRTLGQTMLPVEVVRAAPDSGYGTTAVIM
jgi:hypothetical protein